MTRSLSRAITILTLCSVAAITQAQAPRESDSKSYTLESAITALLDWGTTAVGYNEYRWQKESKSKRDSFRNAPITLSRFPIDATRINVVDGKAHYQTLLDLGRNAEESLDKLGMKTLRKDRRLSEEVKGFSGFGRPGAGSRLLGVSISLREDSDRLAMELAGQTAIDIQGRIVDADPNERGEMRLDIEITSWHSLEN